MHGRRHVLHLIDALTYGGAQELVVLLSRWAPKSLYKTTVCVLQPNAQLSSRVEEEGGRVIPFDRPRPSILNPLHFISYFYRNIRDIVALCRREHVDVIQCHLSDAEFVGIFAGHWARVERVLTTLHYPDLLPISRHHLDPRNFLRRLVTRLLYRWVNAVIAVSEDVAAKVREFVWVSPDKVFTIINGIDPAPFLMAKPDHDLEKKLGLGAGNRVLLTVARLMPPKGHVYLIEAVGLLVKDYPDIQLFLAGDGDLREQLMAQCNALGVSDHVHFLGSRTDVSDLLALTDIFVIPSMWEGTSLALLEAMAAEKAIVATDIPGNRAVLVSPKCGVLVPPGDSESLAAAISYLLEHPEAASEYGQTAGRVVRERFDIRKSIAQLQVLWGKPSVTAPGEPMQGPRHTSER
jgi:glycosyltransferase involved in cell wall biosynthesis